MRWHVFLVPFVCCAIALGTAYAEEPGHTGGGKGQGQGAGGQHKGANPNCPYQDGSGRGGFRSAHEGRGGNHESGSDHHDSDHGSEDEAASFLSGGITAGGGAGGEGFVCDDPGNWHIDTKIFK